MNLANQKLKFVLRDTDKMNLNYAAIYTIECSACMQAHEANGFCNSMSMYMNSSKAH